MHYNMELPDLGLVAWVPLVLGLCFCSVTSIFMLSCVLSEGDLTVCVAFFFLYETSIQKITDG